METDEIAKFFRLLNHDIFTACCEHIAYISPIGNSGKSVD